MNPLEVKPAPIPVERIPHAATPVVLSELAEARIGQAWVYAGGALGVLAVGLLVVGLVVVR